MEMLHHEKDLSDQESSVFKSEGDDFGNNIKEIFSLDELHDEIDEVAVFEEFVEVDDEGMLGSCPKNFFLVHDILNDLRFFNIVAVKNLYCV